MMAVVLAMVASVAAQSCPTGYAEAEIPTFELIKATKSEIDGFISDKAFGNLVYSCFKGLNCNDCHTRARQVMSKSYGSSCTSTPLFTKPFSSFNTRSDVADNNHTLEYASDFRYGAHSWSVLKLLDSYNSHIFDRLCIWPHFSLLLQCIRKNILILYSTLITQLMTPSCHSASPVAAQRMHQRRFMRPFNPEQGSVYCCRDPEELQERIPGYPKTNHRQLINWPSPSP